MKVQFAILQIVLFLLQNRIGGRRMKKLVKRILTVVLAAAIMLAMAPATGITSFQAQAATFKTSGMVYPGETIYKGAAQDVKGIISCDQTIEKVVIGISNADASKWIDGHKITCYPKAKSFDIGKKINPVLRFGDLPAGTYQYRVWANVNGKSTLVKSKKFKVCYGNYCFYSDAYNGHVFSMYGNKNFTESGCAITSIAMIVSNKLGKKVTPDEIYNVNTGNKKLGNDGVYINSWDKIAKYYGLTCNAYNVTTEAQITSYAKKYPQGVILYYTYGNDATHFIVARYKNGSLYYNDPASLAGAKGKSVAYSDHLKLSQCFGSSKEIQKVFILN